MNVRKQYVMNENLIKKNCDNFGHGGDLSRGSDFVTGAVAFQHVVLLQISWQAQHFANLEVQIS